MLTISIKECADRLNCCQQMVRIMLQRGNCPFGYAVQGSGKKFRYFIFRDRFEKYVRGEL